MQRTTKQTIDTLSEPEQTAIMSLMIRLNKEKDLYTPKAESTLRKVVNYAQMGIPYFQAVAVKGRNNIKPEQIPMYANQYKSRTWNVN